MGAVTDTTTPHPPAPHLRVSPYVERQRVPLWWGVGLTVLALTLVVAVWAFLGDAWGLGALVAVLALTGVGLWLWGRAEVRVAEGWLRVAGASIETRWLGEARALSSAQTKAALREGRTAEWLHLRPWLSRAVRITLVDPADRHTSWLVASRHPDELARALEGPLDE